MLRPLQSLTRAKLLSTRLPPIYWLPARQIASSALLSASTNHPLPSSSHSRPTLPTQHRQNGQHFTDSYHLCERLTLLSRRSPSQLDSALVLLKSSPPSVATVVPWNVALNECFHQGKFKLAYETWMDMKRRGIKPTTRSFGTFFSGCARMASRGHLAAAAGGEGLARVRTVWQQWLVHAEHTLERADELRMLGRGGKAKGKGAVKEEIRAHFALAEAVDSAEDINNLPSNNFLTFLAKTGHTDLLLETFSQVPDDGPLSADIVTYSIVLSALKAAVANAGSPDAALARSNSALQVWDRLSAHPELESDTETTSLVISLCRGSPRPQDQLRALGLAQSHFGLFLTADAHKLADRKTARPRVAMDSAALSNVLTLVMKLQKYNLVVEWFDQVRDHPARFGDIVEHWQCDLVLAALGFKKEAQAAEDLIEWMQRSKKAALEPTTATFANALQVCWRAADLARACRLMSLMTGRSIPSATSSATPTTGEPLQLAEDTAAETSASRGKETKTFAPSARAVSTLLQTALATRDRGNIFRTLEIVTSLGFGHAKHDVRSSRQADEADGPEGACRPPPKRQDGDEGEGEQAHAFFWDFKLAEVTERSLERVLQGGEGHLSKEQRKQLFDWRQTVLDWLEANEHVGKSGANDREESMRRRRDQLGLVGSQAGRRYVAPCTANREPAKAEDEGAMRLNRKQRRALVRGDAIRTAATEAGEDDGFRVSSRAHEDEHRPTSSASNGRRYDNDDRGHRPFPRRFGPDRGEDTTRERRPSPPRFERRRLDEQERDRPFPPRRREGYSAPPHESRRYADRERPFRSENKREGSSGRRRSDYDGGGGSRQKGWDKL